MLAMTSSCAVLLLALNTGTFASQQTWPAFQLPLPVLTETLPATAQPSRLAAARTSTSAQDPDDGFEAISELPQDEQLPAAPMVVAAYIFVLLAFFAYVFSLSRRLAAVKQDMSRLESEVKRNSRT